MRTTTKILSLFAVAAMALLGCSKSDEVNVKKTFTHTVTIKATQPMTKTAIDTEGDEAVSYKWSSDDASRFFVKENETVGTDIVMTFEGDNYKKMTLSATFESETSETYTYTAFLSKNKTNVSGGNKQPKIPAQQQDLVNTFDPDADVLIAKPLEFNSAQDELLMQFRRPVVVNKMTLKGLTVGETVSSVEISADQDIIGYYKLDQEVWAGQGNTITVSTNRTIGSDGQLTIYFISMPVEDAILTVKATSGNYIFSKTFSRTISFVEGAFTKFGVNNLTRTAKTDLSGTYILTNEDQSKMACAWKNGDNNLSAVDVTKESSGIVYYDPDVNPIITLAKETTSSSEYYGMYTMVQFDGKYLYAASSSANQLKAKSEADVNAYWEVSNTDGEWSIVASRSTNRNILKYNSDNNIFSCYTSGQNPVVLVSTNNAKPTPVINAENLTIASSAVASTSTGATFNSNTSTVSATAYDDQNCSTTSTWLSASGSSNDVMYSATANNSGSERVGYIKIIASNSDGRSVTKVISVTQPAQGGPTTYTYQFTSKSWGATPDNWTKILDGSGMDSGGRGVAVQKGNNGAGATSPISYTGISKVKINLAKSNKGVGSVAVKVGDQIIGTISSDNLTGTSTDYEFNVSNLSGFVSFVVNCTTSTIYVKSVEITAGGGGDTPTPGDLVTIIIDGSQLTSTATTSPVTNSFGGVSLVLSSGAKLQGSSGANRFTDNAILIGKSGAYIYNSSAIPGRITKFEIYANKGASTKVSVGVNFSNSSISEYDENANNTYSATLNTVDAIYDCSSNLSSNCKYFWYQVTNSNNSQVQFRITYIAE